MRIQISGFVVDETVNQIHSRYIMEEFMGLKGVDSLKFSTSGHMITKP